MSRELLAVRTTKWLIDLCDEYESAYSKAQERAARLIWQSMKRGPDGAPDWDAHEWTRPGGWVFRRGDESVSFNPMEWAKP